MDVKAAERCCLVLLTPSRIQNELLQEHVIAVNLQSPYACLQKWLTE